jgi:hypothetical protein
MRYACAVKSGYRDPARSRLTLVAVELCAHRPPSRTNRPTLVRMPLALSQRRPRMKCDDNRNPPHACSNYCTSRADCTQFYRGGLKYFRCCNLGPDSRVLFRELRRRPVVGNSDRARRFPAAFAEKGQRRGSDMAPSVHGSDCRHAHPLRDYHPGKSLVRARLVILTFAVCAPFAPCPCVIRPVSARGLRAPRQILTERRTAGRLARGAAVRSGINGQESESGTKGAGGGGGDGSVGSRAQRLTAPGRPGSAIKSFERLAGCSGRRVSRSRTSMNGSNRCRSQWSRTPANTVAVDPRVSVHRRRF